jgi:hypothetical protein
MEDKVYTSEIVQDAPFPGDTVVLDTQSPSATGDNHSPTEAKEKTFPVKSTAVELLSTALNTRTRKILESFDLEQRGGIQIGDFEDGISGDITLTRNGILGRNVSGNTTFGLDTNGNLILVGQLRAGSTIINENIITEAASSGNGRTVYYNDGIPAIVIGDPN